MTGAGAAGYLKAQTTVDSREEAMELSRAAEETRLAACAQAAGPIPSAYWCDNAVRQEDLLVLPDAKRPAQGAGR